MQHTVTTTYLEMTAREAMQPKSNPGLEIEVEQVQIPTPEINHFFFVHVGRPWRWYSRLAWSYDDWRKWVTDSRVSTWIGYRQRTPFGYFELEHQGTEVEIAFFGILPQFLGQGLGGPFLSETIQAAWDVNPQRVWLHTCSFDHKYAIANYVKRGFSIYKAEMRAEEIPDDDDPLWLTPNFYRTYSKKYDPAPMGKRGGNMASFKNDRK